MPALGLGTWKSAPDEVGRAVLEAVRAGYRHIDCAWIYGNEAEIGSALKQLFSEGTVTREELWITSKLWNDCHAPEHVEPALRESLRNLGLDALDLYLIHWPVALQKGVLVPKLAAEMLSLEQAPLAETWRAMEGLVEKGLCRSIGVSNFNVPKLEALLAAARVPPAMNQVELHPYLQQNELVAFCQRAGIQLTAYSSLGSADRPAGLKSADEPVLLRDETVARVAARHGVTPAQVLIAWPLTRGIAVLPKSVNPERIRENIEAASLKLCEEDLRELATLDRGQRYVSGSFWVLEGGPYTLKSLWEG